MRRLTPVVGTAADTRQDAIAPPGNTTDLLASSSGPLASTTRVREGFPMFKSRPVSLLREMADRR
jgi:hypothetical protein